MCLHLKVYCNKYSDSILMKQFVHYFKCVKVRTRKSMYTGNNPKALLSMELIIGAFKELFSKNPYNEINIKSLCKKADVSRQTFYNVFNTKEEVLRKCIEQIFQEILDEYSNDNIIGARESIEYFVQIFYKNRQFMDLIIQNHLENILTEEFVYAITNLSRLYQNDEVTHIDYILEFYAGGLTQILVHWMNDSNRVTAEELIDILANQIQMPYF